MKFVDLGAQRLAYREEMDNAIAHVLETTAFINGPANAKLEAELSHFSGAKHSLVCSSGTDALLVALMAFGVGPGDEVIVPAFTYYATASMVAHVGARPVFADVEPASFCIDPEEVRKKITPKTVGIIPVSLYGQIANFDEILPIAEEAGVWVMEDAAQSFGAVAKGKKSCSITRVATTSFFPAKPLGCYGDGGAIFTDDEDLASLMRSILNHGQAARYNHERLGINGRMDTLQSAIVSVKLAHFADEINRRNQIADTYTEALRGVVKTPTVEADRTSTWAQYTVRVPQRDRVREELAERGIPTAVHYPSPLPRQRAFAYLGDTATYPVSEELSEEVLSLPMHAFLSEDDQNAVIKNLVEALGA
jgi:UDP-2-acetamido-2-deoxy-ribo-hexuluronate aminotransferase